MESCRTQHAVIDALQNPRNPLFCIAAMGGVVISSIKICSRYSFMSDVIGPLGTLWNLLKGNFIILKILWSDARQKKKNAELFKSNLIEPFYWEGSF